LPAIDEGPAAPSTPTAALPSMGHQEELIVKLIARVRGRGQAP
jgi:hypothetical protein